jgi:hypothetical protein
MIDILGYAASIAVLATFLMPTMLRLRFVAILSNILFLLYGYFAHIPPVLFLHAMLLPINTARLVRLQECNNSQLGGAVRRFAAAVGATCGFVRSDASIGVDEPRP